MCDVYQHNLQLFCRQLKITILAFKIPHPVPFFFSSVVIYGHVSMSHNIITGNLDILKASYQHDVYAVTKRRRPLGKWKLWEKPRSKTAREVTLPLNFYFFDVLRCFDAIYDSLDLILTRSQLEWELELIDPSCLSNLPFIWFLISLSLSLSLVFLCGWRKDRISIAWGNILFNLQIR